MKYELKIKTGFYETTIYYLSLMGDKIQLVPVRDETKSSINIFYEEIVSITLSKGRHSEIEINTIDQKVLGTFNEIHDLREIFQKLKCNINSKIIYEEE